MIKINVTDGWISRVFGYMNFSLEEGWNEKNMIKTVEDKLELKEAINKANEEKYPITEFWTKEKVEKAIERQKMLRLNMVSK